MVCKRTIWQVRDSDIPEGSPAKYAAALPKVRPSGDAGLDQEHGVIRKEMVALVDMLLRHPEHVQPTKGWLEARIERLQSAKAEGEYFTDVSTLTKLMTDEAFIVGAVMRNSKLTKADLEKVKAYDSDGVKQLFQVMLEASAGLQIPQEMLSKQVANMVVDRRAAQVGNRLKNVAMGKGVLGSGKVIWTEIGPYGLHVRENKVVKIIHRFSGCEVDPGDEVTLTTEYVIDAAHSAMKARAIKGMNKYWMHEFFSPGTGPHHKDLKAITGKSAALQALVKEVEDILAEAARNANQGKEEVDLDDFGKERKRQANVASSEKARAALAKRAKETQGRRRIAIG